MRDGSERTTIAVRTRTRDRVRACAMAQGATVDEFVAQLLDEYEERVFWAQMASASPLDAQELEAVNAAFDADTADLMDS